MEVALERCFGRVQWCLTHSTRGILLNLSLDDLYTLLQRVSETTSRVMNWLLCSTERHLDVMMTSIDPRAVAQPFARRTRWTVAFGVKHHELFASCCLCRQEKSLVFSDIWREIS